MIFSIFGRLKSIAVENGVENQGIFRKFGKSGHISAQDVRVGLTSSRRVVRLYT
jgi:hypothetical protein